jgi:hypothetical protein
MLDMCAKAVKKATNSSGEIICAEKEGEIQFFVLQQDSGTRIISLRPAVFNKARRLLEKMTEDFLRKKGLYDLRNAQKTGGVVKGVFVSESANGYFVKLNESYGFLPKEYGIDAEADGGFYDEGNSAYFELRSQTVKRGKPRIILSRLGDKLPNALAPNVFSVYGFMGVKRASGKFQRVFLRAHAKKESILRYRVFFPSEKIYIQKEES